VIISSDEITEYTFDDGDIGTGEYIFLGGREMELLEEGVDVIVFHDLPPIEYVNVKYRCL
jgi:hypothetical protein